MLALGFCNAESVGMLLEEIQPLIEEYSSTKTSVSAQALEVNTHRWCSACLLACYLHSLLVGTYMRMHQLLVKMFD